MPPKPLRRVHIVGPILSMISGGILALGGPSLVQCLAIPTLLFSLVLCVTGLFSPPRWPSVLGLSLGLVGGGIFAFEAMRLDSGRLRANEYTEMLRRTSGGTSHFPRTIPYNASKVRITAHGVFDWFPAQDSFVDVRYFLPSPDAELVRANAEKAAIPAHRQPPGTNPTERAEHFIRSHGGTPAAFRSYLLVNPTAA